MRGRLVLLAFVVAVGGCQTGPLRTVYKAGTTFNERQFEFDQCKIASFQAIPQSIATEVRGGYYDPGSVQCNAIGSSVHCNRVGEVNIPARSTTYDVNDEMRSRFIDRCLMDKGYQFLERPVCKTDKEKIEAANYPQPANPADVKCSAGYRLDT